MSIYDVDKKRLRHCLGHVSLKLSEADLSDNEIRWGDLESQPQVCKKCLRCIMLYKLIL